MKRVVVVNITDESVGVENIPDDIVIEIRDYREGQVELAWQGPEIDRVQISAQRPPYVVSRFGDDP